MIRTFIMVTICMFLCVVAPALAQQDPSASDEKLYEDVQKQFAEAYNRQDADAMAALFTENGVRVTPNGIFQGRDAIRREIQQVLTMGLHDYTVRRTVSRSEGNLVFNVGEWQAKLGDRQFHGYYSALLIREGDQAKILAQTVNIAVPARQ
jgi:ketosteroid isomerase-like protein